MVKLLAVVVGLIQEKPRRSTDVQQLHLLTVCLIHLASNRHQIIFGVYLQRTVALSITEPVAVTLFLAKPTTPESADLSNSELFKRGALFNKDSQRTCLLEDLLLYF